jgi:hypothetical protein
MLRSPWVVALIGGLLVVGAALLLLDRHAGGNLMAVLGLLGIWICGFLGIVLFEGLVQKEGYLLRISSPDDEQAWAAEAWASERRWDRPAMTLLLFLPGLWVGALAHSPLVVTAGYLLVAEAARRLINVLPGFPPDPPRQRWVPELALEKVGTLAAGLLVGIGLRALLGA